MHPAPAEMKAAFRVLTALNEKRSPAALDIEELRRLAPLVPELPDHDLACKVIKDALQRRAELHRAARAG